MWVYNSVSDCTQSVSFAHHSQLLVFDVLKKNARGIIADRIYSKKATAYHIAQRLICNCPLIESKTYRGAVKSLARPGGRQVTFPTFYGIGSSLPHSQQTTTCPSTSQINPFLLSLHF